MKKIFSVILIICIILVGFATNSGDKLSKTEKYILNQITNPNFGTIGGEWAIIGLAKNDYQNDEYFLHYYENICTMLIAEDGDISSGKNTEFSRLIIALETLGYDSENVAGYNLFESILDYEKTINQGINGAIWALIALNEATYNNEIVEKQYVEYILSKQNDDGGFGLKDGVSDPNITGMALQALAFYDEDKVVKNAVEYLSTTQKDNGSFEFLGEENLENIAQVIIGLKAVGANLEDEKFVKNDNTMIDAMMSYAKTDGSFEHIKDEGRNQMATEQAFLAMITIYKGK